MSRNFERLFALTQYPFTALEIFSTVDEESVASVFVRINSAGVKLNQADFILTLMSVFWDEGRTELETFCRSARRPSTGAPSPYNHFIQPDPDQLLRVSVALAFRRARLEYVYSILRGKDLETRSFSAERRDEQFATLAKAQSYVLHLTHWQEFTQVLRHAGFRSKSMISSEMVFLYSYALFLIGRRDFKVSAHKLRSVIARWFFFAALTSRYSASPETVMEQDLARLRAVHKDDADGFIAVLDNVISETLTNDFWAVNVPNDLASSSARSPALFAYHAALMLLDAKALFSKLSIADLFDPTIVALKPPLDRHHLFPRNYLKGIGVTDIRERNRIANYALVEWSDDIAISDTSPCDYFPKFVTARHITGAELVKTSYWHALPDGWENMTYANFLVERQKLIARVIQDGYATLRDSTLHGEG